jgi:hypothetical protein
MLTFVFLLGLLGLLFVAGAAVWSGPVGFGWPAPRPFATRVWGRRRGFARLRRRW